MPGDRSPFSRKPLTVTVAGVRAEIPYRPAAAWVEELGRLGVLAAVLADAPAREALVRARAAAVASGGSLPEEFVLADLQEARAALEEITGRRAPEDLLEHIFARFCIGK